jgi:hypothetical protein
MTLRLLLVSVDFRVEAREAFFFGMHSDRGGHLTTGGRRLATTDGLLVCRIAENFCLSERVSHGE